MSQAKIALLVAVLVSMAVGLPPLSGQDAAQSSITAAPIPPQIANAKKVFISNAGTESNYTDVRDNYFQGGPNRTYNQFYAAMKSWGRYELVPAPTDADLVLEIQFTYQVEAGHSLTHFKLLFRDPKSNVRLWTLTRYVEPAGMSKNRERNFDVAMSALTEDVKSLVSGTSASK